MSKKVAQSFSKASTSMSAAICPESEPDLEIPSWQPNDIDYCAPFIDTEDWFAYMQETGPDLPGQFTQPEWLQDEQDEDPEWLNERVIYVEEDVFEIHTEVMPVVDGKDYMI